MSHSIFGWDYPPGCNGPPDDYEGPCAICGHSIDKCICPECPTIINAEGEMCGEIGCIKHLSSQQLAALINLLDYQLTTLNDEAKEREKKTAPCPHCWQTQMITIFDEGPIRCGDYEWTSRGWENYFF
jgi:hypothetical protein